ncbi:MAG: hypothetical protein SFW36_18020 [Leptolyngbyaceae cyanobacterium bins.59]|nr:hypothetical protein [Leptolyngbyaceae cyanobacterium bins.59]
MWKYPLRAPDRSSLDKLAQESDEKLGRLVHRCFAPQGVGRSPIGLGEGELQAEVVNCRAVSGILFLMQANQGKSASWLP